jgi:hypothetical protein
MEQRRQVVLTILKDERVASGLIKMFGEKM